MRSQHSTKIREHRKGATPEDFDRIGAEFHRWVQDSSDSLGLTRSNDFFRFIQSDFEFYTRQYMRVVRASVTLTPGLEHIRYNADHGFTLQNMLLLAPLCPDDDDDVIRLKLSLTAHFVDILISRRIWNFHSIAYSTMQYSIPSYERDTRFAARRPGPETALCASARTDMFASNDRLRVHQQNWHYLHRILPDYVETQSGNESRYDAYVSDSGRNRRRWSTSGPTCSRATDEFSHSADSAEYRNRMAGCSSRPAVQQQLRSTGA